LLVNFFNRNNRKGTFLFCPLRWHYYITLTPKNKDCVGSDTSWTLRHLTDKMAN